MEAAPVAKSAQDIPGWLDELNAKYGEPRVNYPIPVNLGDCRRECWVWFPDGRNHNLGIDNFGDHWVVRATGRGRVAELYTSGADRPDDTTIRRVLVTAGMLGDA